MRNVLLVFMFFSVLMAPPVCCAEESQAFIFTSDQMDISEDSEPVREYVRGQTCYSVVMMGGFSKDSNGGVDLVGGIVFRGPNGEVIFENDQFASLKEIVPDNIKVVTLDNAFDVTFEDSDPLGVYAIQTEVQDKISGQSVSSETAILLFDTDHSKKLIMAPVKSAKDLDDLWEEYFRSRNPWAIKRIISALRLRKEAKNVEAAAVGAAAKWSLEVNAQRNPDVLDICKQSLVDTEGSIKELLQEIIINVEASQDGPGAHAVEDVN